MVPGVVPTPCGQVDTFPLQADQHVVEIRHLVRSEIADPTHAYAPNPFNNYSTWDTFPAKMVTGFDERIF